MGREIDDIAHIYDDLKPEDFPKLSHEEAVAWVESQQRAARTVGRPGQVRMDKRRKKLVLLLHDIHDKLESGVRVYKCDWRVEDILTGARYRLNMVRWSEKIFNEMEVLAWAASQ